MGNITRYDGKLTYHLAPLHGFDGLEIPVIKMEDGRCFLPISAICQDVLKVQPQRQIQRLRASGTTARMVREFRIKTKQGMRPALCLDYNGLGHWFQMLDADKLKEGHHLKETLPRFQRAALALVNAVAHGDLPALAPEAAGPATTPRISGADAMNAVATTTEYLEERQRRAEQMLGDHEQRLTDVEELVTRPYPMAYVEDAPETEADAGVFYVPFTCPSCGRPHRLRMRAHVAAEVVDVEIEE